MGVNASSVRLRTRFRVSLAALAAIAAITMTVIVSVASAGSSPDLTHPEPASVSGSAVAVPVADAKTATVLEINGAIGPATSRYITKGLEAARLNGSRVVVLQIDTPGGLDSSMRDIIRAILASPIPVVSYVSPPGARAASAGTYILYASHVAAMAPATNLGAATPVSIGGGNERGSGRPDEGAGEKPTTKTPEQATGNSPGQARAPGDQAGGSPTPPEGAATQSPMERKVLNDAVAYIRGLAELRGRNAEWAEQAVRGAASLSASAALQQNVIDVVARDLPDLLTQIDGREVHVGNHLMKLATRDLAITNLGPDWRVELLSVITNPTIAYGLLLIGIYGLLFEGYNPGAVFPGVTGAIALLIALFAFQILSVNYAGLALVALGIGMIVSEFFFPAFGSLGLGGLIAFIVGSLILFDTDIPGMNIGLPVIAAVATVGGLAIVAMAWVASRSLRRPVVTGVQAMVGETAESIATFTGRGRVRYGGEIWNAVSASSVRSGQIVRITRIDGLTVWVEPV
jgi:membrane-bound serine protease (ClpP class)